MPQQISAGLMMFHENKGQLKVFLVHPGGPFFVNKDDGWWGIPKGLIEDNENPLNAAIREFEEETGIKPFGDFISLGTVVQKGGKVVHGWAFRCGNSEPIEIKCNTFNIEWPPRSGNFGSFPEVDKGAFFDLDIAKVKINSAQKEFLQRLKEYLVNKGN